MGIFWEKAPIIKSWQNHFYCCPDSVRQQSRSSVYLIFFKHFIADHRATKRTSTPGIKTLGIPLTKQLFYQPCNKAHKHARKKWRLGIPKTKPVKTASAQAVLPYRHDWGIPKIALAHWLGLKTSAQAVLPYRHDWGIPKITSTHRPIGWDWKLQPKQCWHTGLIRELY